MTMLPLRKNGIISLAKYGFKIAAHSHKYKKSPPIDGGQSPFIRFLSVRPYRHV